jgi:hypothetical protein
MDEAGVEEDGREEAPHFVVLNDLGHVLGAQIDKRLS